MNQLFDRSFTRREAAALFASGLLVASAGCLGGCTSGAGNITSHSTESGEAANMDAEKSANDGSIPLNTALQNDGLYLLKGEFAYSFTPGLIEDSNSPFWINDNDNSGAWRTYGSSFDEYTSEELPADTYHFVTCQNVASPYLQLSRNEGDKIISVGTNALNCTILPVKQDGYYPGFELTIQRSNEYSSREYPIYGIAVNGADVDIAEINGVDVTNPTTDGSSPGGDAALKEFARSGLAYETVGLHRDGTQILGPNGYSFSKSLITSGMGGRSFTIGYYQGSTFDTGAAPLNDYFYFAATIDTSVERGKEGYCTVDISSLDPGYYLVKMEISDAATQFVPVRIVD